MTSIPGFTVKGPGGKVVAPDPGQKHPGRRRYQEDGSLESEAPPPTQNFQVRLPRGLHYAFKRKCHKERESMNGIVVELVRQWTLGKIDLEMDIERGMAAARRRRRS